MASTNSIIEILSEHERKFRRSFSLIPSENILSPFARLSFLSDSFSRYFFDEKEASGQWSFQGGSIVGRIQNEVLIPLLQRFGQARYVDVHANSGLGGMILVLMAYGRAGSSMLSIPPRFGGHQDTRFIGTRLGMMCHDIPFSDWMTIDLEALTALVSRERPCLVYFDQATSLSSLDWKTVVSTIRAAARDPIHVHIDTSHVNAFVWGGQLPNPLSCGANTYGGSTHKTFPGPHKAVLFTNDADLFKQLTLTAANTISHHHMASVVALAISLIEFDECGGRDYAAQILHNAVAFANALAEQGFDIQGAAPHYTATHQVWMAAPPEWSAHDLASRLFDVGLVVNPYYPLPSLGGLGIRMGVNEATRLGLTEPDVRQLAMFCAAARVATADLSSISNDVAAFRSSFHPAYCFDETTFDRLRQVLYL
jgi:glycine hydroxymethyltransferase